MRSDNTVSVPTTAIDLIISLQIINVVHKLHTREACPTPFKENMTKPVTLEAKKQCTCELCQQLAQMGPFCRLACMIFATTT